MFSALGLADNLKVEGGRRRLWICLPHQPPGLNVAHYRQHSDPPTHLEENQGRKGGRLRHYQEGWKREVKKRKWKRERRAGGGDREDRGRHTQEVPIKVVPAPLHTSWPEPASEFGSEILS